MLGPLENVEFCVNRQSAQSALQDKFCLALCGIWLSRFNFQSFWDALLGLSRTSATPWSVWDLGGDLNLSPVVKVGDALGPRHMQLRNEPGSFVGSFSELRELYLSPFCNSPSALPRPPTSSWVTLARKSHFFHTGPCLGLIPGAPPREEENKPPEISSHIL